MNAREKRKQKDTKQRKQEEEKDIETYKSNLQLAVKISKTEIEYTDQQINKLVRKLVELANKIQLKGLVKGEELKIISQLLFQAEMVDVNNVLAIARLYLRMKNYQASIYTLNYSKDFLDKEEDLQRVAEAVKMIGIYKRKKEAVQMLEQGYSMEVIQQRTKLSLADLIELKNRKFRKNQNGSNNKKLTDSQGDDEFPDI